MNTNTGLAACLLIHLCLVSPLQSQVAVTTHHNDNRRSGVNSQETALTLSNVNKDSFGKLYSFAVDGELYAQPLLVPNVNTPQGTFNVVYAATEHDSVFAFDADGSTTSPLWQVTFIDEANGITTVPADDTGECCDIQPEIGITGTPVIDRSTGTLYVVAETKENGTDYVQRLHALDIATGAEKFGGPVVIAATVPGTGDGSDGTNVSFITLHANQREALLLLNGVVYIAFASHGDNGPFHGWVLGYDAATLDQVMVFNDTPNGSDGGIWQSGAGLSTDGTNLFLVVGNGTFDADGGGADYGSSFIKLSTSGKVLDYFAPHDQAPLSDEDMDIGSGGEVIPDQSGQHPHLMISASKDGTIYVVDRDAMGGFNSVGDQVLQELVHIFPSAPVSGSAPGGGFFSSPVYWNNTVYFGVASAPLQAFGLNGLLSQTPTSQTGNSFYYPGAAISLSANGSNDPIVWAIEASGADIVTPAILHAYDANNLGNEFYNSTQAGGRDTAGGVMKFVPPTIANGKVFVATATELDVFGLFGPTPSFTITANPGSPAITAGSSLTIQVAVNGANGFDGAVALSLAGLPRGITGTFDNSSIQAGATANLTLTSGATAQPGSYSFSVAGQSGGVTQTTNVGLVVNAAPAAPTPDFSLTASPASGTVKAGGSANFQVALTARNGFSNAVALSCSSGLPKGATCTFKPSSLTPSATATTAQLAVSTTGQSAMLAPNSQPWFAMYTVVGLCGGMLLFMPCSRGRRKGLLGVVLLLGISASLVGCGGGASQNSNTQGTTTTTSGTPGTSTNATPAGTYTIVVTATSGTLQHTTSLQLVVQ